MSQSEEINGTLHSPPKIRGSLTSSKATISGSLFKSEKIGGGVTVPSTLMPDVYQGEYVIEPKAFEDTVLETKYKTMTDNVKVLEIPYFETSNESGTTVYIGGTLYGN